MSLLHLDPALIITTVGYAGVFAIVFAESGLFFGFFLPGDSLLFTAGLLAATGVLSLPILLILIPLAAVLGDSVGYWFGAWLGPRIFTKQDSFFFSIKHVERSQHFYQKYGPRAIILARFIPVVRTFVPIVAGVGSMKYATFLTYNIIGGIGWGLGITLLGYFLGRVIPNAENYLLPIIAVIIVISFLPLVREWWNYRKGNSTIVKD